MNRKSKSKTNEKKIEEAKEAAPRSKRHSGAVFLYSIVKS